MYACDHAIPHDAEGDPFLAELYRRVGALELCTEVTVYNTTGGIQLPDNALYREPRYRRQYAPRGDVLKVRHHPHEGPPQRHVRACMHACLHASCA